jgi:GNAT superfamily N-acetyltransferase
MGNGPTVVLQRARAENAAWLSEIAHAAKSYWGYPAQWIELWHNQLTVTPDYVAEHETWMAVVDGAILGFYALAGKAPTLKLDHLWIMPVAIGQGIGRALFRHALERAAACGATVLEIEADPNAEGFYEHMGAETVGEVSYIMEGVRRVLPLMRITVSQPVAL